MFRVIFTSRFRLRRFMDTDVLDTLQTVQVAATAVGEHLSRILSISAGSIFSDKST